MAPAQMQAELRPSSRAQLRHTGKHTHLPHTMNTTRVHFDNASEAREIGALVDQLTDRIEKDHGLELLLRDLNVTIQGLKDPAEKISNFIEDLRKTRNRIQLNPQAVNYAYEAFNRGEDQVFEKLARIRIDVSPRKPSIFPKTLGQKIYLNAIQENSITFGLGPAGTGKTYLAMAMAVAALLKDDVSRIILTRPAIEAGENLGFLPGDFQQKVAPYLRPLYDALHDMLPRKLLNLISSAELLRLHHWPTCAGAHSTMPLSFWTKHRTQPRSKCLCS